MYKWTAHGTLFFGRRYIELFRGTVFYLDGSSDALNGLIEHVIGPLCEMEKATYQIQASNPKVVGSTFDRFFLRLQQTTAWSIKELSSTQVELTLNKGMLKDLNFKILTSLRNDNYGEPSYVELPGYVKTKRDLTRKHYLDNLLLIECLDI